MISEDWIHYVLNKKKKFPLGFSDLSAFFKYVVYLFKDLAKKIKNAYLNSYISGFNYSYFWSSSCSARIK